MPHNHDHPHTNRQRLAWTLALTAAYLIAEVVGGLLTNSFALLADAGHMLTDVASLALALFAIWLAGRPAPANRTYGYHRAEILAALVNGASLLAACVWILYEAAGRLQSPAQVLGSGMFAVACGGLLVNLIAVKILHGSHAKNLNIRGAWLHVLSDLLGSVAAIIGAILVWTLNWHWADPAASIIIALLVLYAAWRLLAEAVSVLMESVPAGIDVDKVRDAIIQTPGVASQHDLHIWSITSGRVCLSVHVTAVPEQGRADILRNLQAMLRTKFDIRHTTIQIEPEGYQECDNCDVA